MSDEIEQATAAPGEKRNVAREWRPARCMWMQGFGGSRRDCLLADGHDGDHEFGPTQIELTRDLRA